MPLIIGDDETTECFLDRLTESAKGWGCGEAPGILLQALSHEALGKFKSKLREAGHNAAYMVLFEPYVQLY
eukprot:SAG22_NODE_1843_length_3455_cov_2.608760_3_plen_71_part_00